MGICFVTNHKGSTDIKHHRIVNLEYLHDTRSGPNRNFVGLRLDPPRNQARTLADTTCPSRDSVRVASETHGSEFPEPGSGVKYLKDRGRQTGHRGAGRCRLQSTADRLGETGLALFHLSVRLWSRFGGRDRRPVQFCRQEASFGFGIERATFFFLTFDLNPVGLAGGV